MLAKDRLIAKQTAEVTKTSTVVFLLAAQIHLCILQIQELQEELESLKEPSSCFANNQDSIVTIEERNTVSVSTNVSKIQFWIKIHSKMYFQEKN